MRSELDGTFAGSGTYRSYYENEETYKDKKVRMTTEYDYLTKEERQDLNGEVVTYYIDKEGNRIEPTDKTV